MATLPELSSANITILRVFYRESKTDVVRLKEIRDELRRRSGTSAKALLSEVEKELGWLASGRLNLMNSGKTIPGEPNAPSPPQGNIVTAPRILTSRETAAQKRIAELRIRLLDLSNRNPLLNYKFSNRSRKQVRLVDELIDQILGRLQDGKRLVIRSLPEPGDEPEDEKSEAFLLALEQGQRSDEEYLTALGNLNDDDEGENARRIERALRDRLRKSLELPDRRKHDQISQAEWARQNGINPSFELRISDQGQKDPHLVGDLQSLLLPDEMERSLSAIHDQARTALQQTGANTLYLALGYLEWYETANAQTSMYAPLLLHPVELKRKIISGKYRYSLASLGEETETNIALSERLHQDFHRRVPLLDADETPEAYFRKVEAMIEGMPGWRVRRFAVVGHFAFSRLVMFHDLEETLWPDGIGIIGNRVIAEMFAGHGTTTDALFAEDYMVDEPTIAAKVPLLITDADSSQFSAIADAMDGKNLAIKGPPGTGKSQTITNIVAAALGVHKTVLFVSEKMAALNVVKDRLENAGLGDFCLELHSTKAQKKDIVESLRKRLTTQGQLVANGDDLPIAIAELGRLRDQLSDYVAAINHRFGAGGKTIHQILWSEQCTRIERRAFPKTVDDVELAAAKEMTRLDVAALKNRLEVLARAYADAAEGGSLKQNPWFGMSEATLDYFGCERLVRDMKGTVDALRQLSRVIEVIGKKVRAPLSKTIRETHALNAALGQLPEPAPEVDLELYGNLHDPAAAKSLHDLRVSQLVCLNARAHLAESATDPQALTRQKAEIDVVVSLANEVGLDDRPLRELAVETTDLGERTEKIALAATFGRQIYDAFRIDAPVTVGAVRKLIAGVKHAASLPDDLRALRHSSLFNEAASPLLVEAHERAEILRQKVTPLAERLAFELDGQAQEWRRLAEMLRTARFPYFGWLRPSATAKARYRNLLRNRANRQSRFEMAADFEQLAECEELAGSFDSDIGLQTVCGPHFRGHETPFGSLIAINTYAISICQAYNVADTIESHIRHVLLEGPTEALAEIAAFDTHPDMAAVIETVQTIEDTQCDLAELRTALKTRADKITELDRRALALGFSADTQICTIPSIADAVGDAHFVVGIKRR